MAIRKSSISGTQFGTSSDRPLNPSIGQTFYNGTLGVQEIYTSSGWLPATGANDFNVTLNGLVTTATFTKEYFAGAYTIASSLLDSTYDIYVYDTAGNQVGYTKSPSLNATGNFNKIVIIGGTQGDLLSFSYKTTFTATVTSNQVTAGPFITSLTPATLANINDTTTVTGGNFATNVQAVFIGTDNVERTPKSLVRNSVTSLTLTRPDTFPQIYEPYSVKVTNPGITSPTGSNLHILSNSVDAGSSPIWTTAGALTNFKKGVSYTYNLSASDADSLITYEILSGALPSGLSLNNSTGVISGTPTVNSGTPYTFVISATDTAGNTTNSSSLTLSQVVPDAPTIGSATLNSTTEVSVSFTAPAYVGTSAITSYTVTSSPGNVTATGNSSPIAISGLNGSTAYTFTVKATNSSGHSENSSSSNSISLPSTFNYVSNSTQSWTAPSGVTSAQFHIWGAGGGGSVGGEGGYTTGTYTVVPGRVYNIYVGATGSGRLGGWPGGGTASSTGDGAGRGGGGYSAIQDSTNSVYLAIAGAGGGAAGGNKGYKGGGTTGESTENKGYGVNTGGTQSAGGVAGVTVDGQSGNGSFLTGGNSSNIITGGHNPGGGGGAGYYGGAGGVTGGGAITGGPGGSGYVNPSYTSNGTTIQGVGSYSLRGTAGNPDNNGRVLIVSL